MAGALLARALELQDAPDPPEGSVVSGVPSAASEELFQCLLALHALCAADVGLLMQEGRDQQRVVHCLAPYLKASEGQGEGRWGCT